MYFKEIAKQYLLYLFKVPFYKYLLAFSINNVKSSRNDKISSKSNI